MIVGTAYVEIHAVTEKVKSEIKRGFEQGMSGQGEAAGKQFTDDMGQEVLPGMEKVGDDAGKRLEDKVGSSGGPSGDKFTTEMSKSVKKGSSKIDNILKKAMGDSGGNSGRSFASKFGDGVSKFFKGFPLIAPIIGSVTSFIPAALSSLSALVGGLVAVASAAGQAAGAVPAIYAGVASLITVGLSAKLALMGVGGAISTGLTGTAAAAKTALDKLTPPAREFAKTIIGLKPQIDKLKSGAAASLFPGLTAAIKNLIPLLPLFQKAIDSLDGSLGNTADRISKLMAGPLKGTLAGTLRDNSKIASTLLHALVPLADALLRLYHAIQPVTLEFAQSALAAARAFDAFIKIQQANGNLAAYFQRSHDRAAQLFDIVKNLIGIVLNVGHAASSTGESILTSIDKATKGWEQFTGTVVGQDKLKGFFASIKPDFDEIAIIIGHVIKGIAGMGSSNKTLLPLLDAINNQLIPALGRVLQATGGPVAQSIVELFTSLANALAKISGGPETGFLNSFARTLNAMAKALGAILSVPGVRGIAGILAGIAGSVVAVGVVLDKLHLLGFVKNLLGLGSGAKEAAKGFDALKVSKMSEAEKLEANDKLAAKHTGTLGKLKGAASSVAKAFSSFGGILVIAGAKIGGVFSKIGDLLEPVGEAIGEVMGTIGDLLEPVAALLEPIVEAFAALGAIIASLPIDAIVAIVVAIIALGVGAYEAVKHFGAIETFFTKTLPHAVEGAVKAIGGFFSDLPGEVGRFMARVPSAVLTGVKKVARILGSAAEWGIAAAIVLFVYLPIKVTQALARLVGKIPGVMKQVATTLEHGASAAVNATVGFFSRLPGEVGGALSSLASRVKSVSNRAYNELKSDTQDVISAVAGFFARLPGRVYSAMSDLASRIKSVATRAYDDLKSATTSAISAVVGFLQRLPNRSGSALAALPGVLQHAASSAFSAMGSAVSTGVSHVVNFIQAIPGKIRAAIPNALGVLKTIGQQIVQGLINGMSSIESDIGAKAEELVGHIPGPIRKLLHIGSPSRVMFDIGVNVVEGLINGINSKFQSLRSAMTTVGQTITKGIETSIPATNAAIEKARKSIESGVRSIRDSVASRIRSLGNTKSDLDERKKLIDYRKQLDDQEDKSLKRLDGFSKRLDSVAKRYAANAAKLASAQNALNSLTSAKSSLESSITSSIQSFADVTGIAATGQMGTPGGTAVSAGDIASGLASRLAAIKTFAANIKTLIARHLNSTTIEQIVQEGPDSGGPYAAALVKATATQLKSINSSQASINSATNALATTTGNALYNAGISAAQGLVDGLKKKQKELNATATALGKEIATALKKALGIKSPSTVIRDEVGQHVGTGLAEGIEAYGHIAISAAEKLAKQVAVAVTPNLSTMKVQGTIAALGTGPGTIGSAIALSQRARGGDGASAFAPGGGGISVAGDFVVRNDSDITKIGRMLYRSNRSTNRAAGTSRKPAKVVAP